MKKKTKNILIWGLIVLGIIGAVAYSSYESEKPGELDSFAMCLDESGTTFYGAFWCPHCKAQKKLFGNSEKLLPYTECSNPDRKTRTQVCIDAGIESYPTWEFPDDSRLTGEIQLKTLAEKSGCTL